MMLKMLWSWWVSCDPVPGNTLACYYIDTRVSRGLNFLLTWDPTQGGEAHPTVWSLHPPILLLLLLHPSPQSLWITFCIYNIIIQPHIHQYYWRCSYIVFKLWSNDGVCVGGKERESLLLVLMDTPRLAVTILYLLVSGWFVSVLGPTFACSWLTHTIWTLGALPAVTGLGWDGGERWVGGVGVFSGVGVGVLCGEGVGGEERSGWEVGGRVE